ncbi:MAG TPA: zinc ribbon domain-containing protein [bacterium]|nr:zinc ribbon domain-containing protein [bacterium]
MKKFLIVIFIFSLYTFAFAEWFCPVCKTTNKDEYQFCLNCGAPKTKKSIKKEIELIKCLNCEKLFNKEFQYCPYCGAVNYFYGSKKSDEIIVWGAGKIKPIKARPEKEDTKKEEITLTSTLIKSTILPGLGHYYLDKEYKTIIFSILSLGTLGMSINYKMKADDYYDKYNSVDLNKLNYNLLEEYKNKTDDYKKKSNIFLTAAIICWIYNLVDVYKDYNHYILEQKKKAIMLNVEPNQVKIEKKF